jgi:hypothetical protein
MADQPLDHVIRSWPPWRRGDPPTECGREPTGVQVITRDAFLARVRKLGQQRAAMTMCMTCWETCTRRRTWTSDPVAVMARETGRWDEAEKARLTKELRALAALVAAHEEEFYGFLDDLEDTVDIRTAMRRRTVDRARGVDPKHPRPL